MDLKLYAYYRVKSGSVLKIINQSKHYITYTVFDEYGKRLFSNHNCLRQDFLEAIVERVRPKRSQKKEKPDS